MKREDACRTASAKHPHVSRFKSDYDGVFALPAGLEDVSEYPNLVAKLLKRDYSDEDIGKILSGNALRVWTGVERVAQELQQRQ